MQLSALATVHGAIIFVVATQLNAVIGSDSEQQFTDGGHGHVEKVRRIGNGRMIFALAGSSGFADSSHTLKLDFNHLIESALSGISPGTTLTVEILKAAFLPVCASISSYISSNDKAFASIAFYPWISGVLLASQSKLQNS